MVIGSYLRSVPVEFLTDGEAAAYGRYAGTPSQDELDRMFFLDDEDRALIGRHRGGYMRAGVALQLMTVRWLGTFLEDPPEVPGAVLDFVAGQLGVADPSQVKRYTERTKTRFDHQWEIPPGRQAEGVRRRRGGVRRLGGGPLVDVRGPTQVDLPRRDGVAAGADPPAVGRTGGLLTTGQRYVLDQLLEVPPGSRRARPRRGR